MLNPPWHPPDSDNLTYQHARTHAHVFDDSTSLMMEAAKVFETRSHSIQLQDSHQKIFSRIRRFHG